MGLLVWIGSAITALGIAGLLMTAYLASKARLEAADDATLRARLQRLVALNLGALAFAALGLVVVVTGLFLR